MANFTTTTSATFIPEVWSSATIVATEANLVVAPRVKRFDAEVAEYGDVIHVPNISNFSAARDKAANTTVTLDTITETSVDITIDQHKYVAFAIEDKLAKQSKYDLTAEYTDRAGYQIAKAVDTDLLALYSGFTTTDVGSYESDITDATILAAIQQLELNDVPMEDRAFIIHAGQMTALLGIDKFVKADYLGQYDMPTPVQKGPNTKSMFGTLYGIPVFYSTNVAITTGTTNYVHNVLIHKEAWSLAMQMAPRVQMEYDLDLLADKVVTDVIYGVKTLRGDFGVELRSTKV
jgi:hypothetical protein